MSLVLLFYFMLRVTVEKSSQRRMQVQVEFICRKAQSKLMFKQAIFQNTSKQVYYRIYRISNPYNVSKDQSGSKQMHAD